MIAPVFRIVLQDAQPLEGLLVGTISDLAEQFVGILLEVQQIIHIHQHFLGLLVFRQLQFLLEGIESTDTVRISFCLPKLLWSSIYCFRYSFMVTISHQSHQKYQTVDCHRTSAKEPMLPSSF